eukprot:scaffold544_cov320-Pavlova_lutheri.AAC.80
MEDGKHDKEDPSMAGNEPMVPWSKDGTERQDIPRSNAAIVGTRGDCARMSVVASWRRRAEG